MFANRNAIDGREIEWEKNRSSTQIYSKSCHCTDVGALGIHRPQAPVRTSWPKYLFLKYFYATRHFLLL